MALKSEEFSRKHSVLLQNATEISAYVTVLAHQERSSSVDVSLRTVSLQVTNLL